MRDLKIIAQQHKSGVTLTLYQQTGRNEAIWWVERKEQIFSSKPKIAQDLFNRMAKEL